MDCVRLTLLVIFFISCAYSKKAAEVPFDQNYVAAWGGNHITVLDQEREVQLLIDQSSGSGFRSKQSFGSGFFRIRMKIPSKNTKGILTTFFLTSAIPNQPAKNHDELDFEFLGSAGKGYALNTNVFANDFGGREQQFRLWFFVDGKPIRVFKNNKRIGANYLTNPMHIETSLWNATWAGNVDWSQEPFIANYRGFEIEGCIYDNSNPNKCYSQTYYWNAEKYLQLSPTQRRIYEVLRKKYMFYDYCTQHPKNYVECRSTE
ncbi:unnamed protein product [Fraxinus pennsylvanica]|uniref:GH16 domain-containing protein n=1 Tax=Fraxinus pennsylvanica TaxID=56036 RepID=A0AAD2DMP4_9LAMI|nr:unnamed protein product [Fraxinus pennsylvanica]